MSTDTDAVGLREFGRRLGVSGEAVRKAIATGRIPADCVGERVVGKGQRRPVITDPARAAEQWHLQRDPSQVRTNPAARVLRQNEAPPAEPPEEPENYVAPSITESRAITEDFKARMARLDFEERSGRLVDAELVKVKFVNMITAARNAVLGVPTRAKQRLPHLTVQDVETLEALIAEALESVAADGR